MQDHQDDCFDALTRTMEDGALVNDLGRKVRDTIIELRAQAEATNLRKSGTVTLTIKLTHDPKNVLESTATIKVKVPEVKRGTSIHFTTEDGDISSRRPERQTSLQEVVDREKGKLLALGATINQKAI